MDSSIPDSQELSEEVTSSVRVMEIQEYGKDKLPAGPGIDESDEVLVVEGRADVVTLLKYGFKNAIAINGSSVPQTVIDLSKQKIVTVFVDGDRGGDLNIKEMMAVAEVDFVTKAPDGKEVEELMKKEIHKALRGKVAAEQVKLDIQKGGDNKSQSNNQNNKSNDRNNKSNDRNSKSNDRNSRSNDRRSDNKKNYSQGSSNRPQRSKTIDNDTKKHLKEMLDNLVGTRGAYILDNKNNILGKVPTSEIVTTLKNLTSGIQTIVMDGEIDKEIAQAADNAEVEFLVGRNTKLNTKQYKAMILQEKDL
jgi:DNA primase